MYKNVNFKLDEMKTVVFLVLLLPVIGFSQRVELPIEFYRNSLNANQLSNKQYQGNPYLNEEFVEGKITVDNELNYKKQLRYNAYSDIFELRGDDNQINALLRSTNVTVLIDNSLFALNDYLLNNAIKEGYFEKLNRNGKTILLKQYSKKFIDVVKAKSSYQSDSPAKFVLDKSYFIKKNEVSPAIKIILKKKNILSVLNDKEILIKEYISKNKLNLKNEQDVVQLFDYYNSL
jgi:hypothetical protein